MVKVRVRAEVRPSEDESKVLKAIQTFFDYDKLIKEKDGIYEILIVESDKLTSLLKLHRILRREKILDVSRKYLMKGLQGSTITFMLNKQAAAVGVISFVDSERESSLGPIIVEIESKNPKAIIDWLTPKTAKGVPLWENPIPEDV